MSDIKPRDWVKIKAKPEYVFRLSDEPADDQGRFRDYVGNYHHFGDLEKASKVDIDESHLRLVQGLLSDALDHNEVLKRALRDIDQSQPYLAGGSKGIAGDIATMALQGRSPYEIPKSRFTKE